MHANNDTNTTTAGLLAALKDKVAAMQTSEAWMAHLKAVARFHSYSLNNVLLIQMQRPDATRIAGYRTWQALGRQVQKGEHGIRILAPLVVKRRRDDAAATEEAVPAIVGFRTVSVFDVSQTAGKPLPEEDLFRTLTGSEDRAAAVFERLHRFATQDLGIPVAIERIEGSAKGYLQLTPPVRIVVGEQYAPLQRAKTLAHELGHAILHRQEGNAGEDLHSRPEKEMEAESVAYVVMARFGLDSSDYSIPYLASWAEGDAEQLLRSGARIQHAAGRILDACLKESEGTSQEEAA